MLLKISLSRAKFFLQKQLWVNLERYTARTKAVNLERYTARTDYVARLDMLTVNFFLVNFVKMWEQKSSTFIYFAPQKQNQHKILNIFI